MTERPEGDVSVPEETVPETETLEASGRKFKTIIAVLIAVTSVLGSLIAYRASQHSGTASGLDQQATQQMLRKRQAESAIDALVENDQRLFARYQEHVIAWRTFQSDAEDLKESQPFVAATLEEQAKGELALARRVLRFFSYGPPLPSQSDDEGEIEYEADEARSALRAGSAPLGDLRPGRFAAQAGREGDKALQLSGVAALSIVALFFLTIAEIARRRRAHLLAAAGTGALVVTFVLFLVVEVST